MKPALISAVTAALTLAACAGDPDYTPVSFTVEGDRVIAMGAIDAGTEARFNDAVAGRAGLRTLVLQNIPGSVDDDANLAFARMIRDLGLATVVPSDGLVASGGTDLFLAGVTRTLEPGACVGVHSWGAGDFTGRDVPRNSPEHAPYFAYYDYVGIDGDFYWFTLDAAPAEDIHWMTAAEVATYGLVTGPAADLSGAPICDTR